MEWDFLRGCILKIIKDMLNTKFENVRIFTTLSSIIILQNQADESRLTFYLLYFFKNQNNGAAQVNVLQ